MNIYQKLIEVRKRSPYLQKENQGAQYKYVSSSQTLSSLKIAMDELGLLLVPKVIGKEVTAHINAKDTKVYFTELLLEYTWINSENPEEQITCPWYGQGLDTAGEKGVGKALTYAEKYFMLKFFNIPTDKDDPDAFQKKNGDDKQQQETNKKIVFINNEQLGAMRDIINSAPGYSESDFCAEARIQSLEQLPAERFKGAFNHVQSKAAVAA